MPGRPSSGAGSWLPGLGQSVPKVMLTVHLHCAKGTLFLKPHNSRRGEKTGSNGLRDVPKAAQVAQQVPG